MDCKPLDREGSMSAPTVSKSGRRKAERAAAAGWRPSCGYGPGEFLRERKLRRKGTK